MRVKRALHAILAISLIAAGVVRPLVAHAKPQPHPPQRALERLGYSKGTASRMLALQPRLAERVLKSRTRPVVLYRGLDVDRSAFDFSHAGEHGGRIFASPSLHFAVGYAANYHEDRLRAGDREGVVLKLEVPRSLLTRKDGLVSHFANADVPDLRAVTAEVGTLSLRRVAKTRDGDVDEARTATRIRWRATP